MLETFCSFCKTLLNLWTLYTEISSNAFKTFYFLQIHSVKCCHPLFIILGIVSIILYGTVALCLFWLLSVSWFPFMYAVCFAKVGRWLLFLTFWDKTVISRYSAVNSPQKQRNMDTIVLPINNPSFCRSLKFYCPTSVSTKCKLITPQIWKHKRPWSFQEIEGFFFNG